ncbi:site-specific integrase [Vibrio fluvialis]|nr:site-specific integrase [Vibrio fluvialis]
MALTDSKLKSMLGKQFDVKRPKRIADRDGLNILWRPTGKLSWIYRYRFNNKEQELTIGKYTSDARGMGLKEARDKAAICRRFLDEGRDPKIELKREKKGREKQEITVKDALEYWLCEYAAQNRSNVEKHRAQFTRHIYPYLGKERVEECRTDMWIECFDRIKKGSKELKQRPAPVAAGYVLQNVKQALRFCRVRRFAVNNSLNDVMVNDVGSRQGKKDRYLTESELQTYLRWLNEGEMPPYYRKLLFLLTFFGCRTQEARLSTYKEWDLEGWVWTVPKEHSKSKEKIVRPIPPEYREFITSVLLSSGGARNPLVLGEEKTSEAVSMYGLGIWKKIGHKEAWTLHDLRRTFSTHLNELGIEPYVVEKLLGHSLGGVLSIYNRSQYVDKKFDALSLWGKHCNSLIDSKVEMKNGFV